MSNRYRSISILKIIKSWILKNAFCDTQTIYYEN